MGQMAAGSSCDLCRENQLEMECCRGGLLRHSTGPGDPTPDGEEEEEEDRISALPDDLLLQVLAGLRCARAAAHTGLLALRWRGLWARLPGLAFHCTAPGPLRAALAAAGAARPAPSLLDIDLFGHHPLEADQISSLLRAAAALAPAELVVDFAVQIPSCRIDLPCFDRTASITLKASHRRPSFAPPPGGGFPALESLHLDGCDIDLGNLLPRCPCLRKLRIMTGWYPSSVEVASASLQELLVYANGQIQHIDIAAPALKKLYLDAHRGVANDFSLSLSAPAVEDLTWKCECKALSRNRFGVAWRLWNMEQRTCLQRSEHTQLAHVLSLNLEANVLAGDESKSFEQEISQFIVADFSILELDLTPRRHVYGAIVIHLLGFCTSIQRLIVKLDTYLMGGVCGFKHCSCESCDQPNNWRSQSIPLNDLKEVEIRGFKGQDHEVDLLKLLLRCAIVLERVTLSFSSMVSPNDSAYIKIDSILKAYPSVECNII
ncbi:hypothetical protein ACP4OV_007333 [Aristida adscensionis]